MSAPPTGLPNGSNPPPPGAPPLRRRKPASANPLVARKRPVPPPKPKPVSSSTKPKPTASKNPNNNVPNFYGVQAPKIDTKTQEEWKQRRRANGGWWDPPPAAEDFQEIPVYMTKKDIKDGLRAHIMRFAKTRTTGVVDIMDDTQFPRPVTLHRKDARDVNTAHNESKEPSESPAPVDPVEAERLAKIKAEKEAQRALDQAQIAPVSRDAVTKKPVQKQERQETKAFYAKRSDDRKKENNIRYEESLPWVIEDADGKSAFVSQYMGPLSESMVALQFEGAQVRALPLEKFYKFTHKPPFKAYSIEEAEALMKKQVVPGRWSMRQGEKDKVKEEMHATRQALHGRSMVKMESNTFRSAARSEKQEHDDIDFSGDEFQDDDENPTFDRDNDEEVKDARDRIRREQLGANLFGDADEKEIEEELKREEAEEEARKRLGKDLTKHLVKYEKHLEYKMDPEDSSDLGLDTTSEEESDAEKEKEKEKEKQEGKPDVKQEDDQKTTPDQKSGNGSKATASVPPNNKQKSMSDTKKVNSLKRPGSPNLSELESSGNESSRKRVKKNVTGSVQNSRASTPVQGSQWSKKAGGAASDGEATGAETDAGRKKFTKKIKLVSGSHGKGTPTGSRVGSPVPGASQFPSGSQSPNNGGPSTPNSASVTTPVTKEEIIAALAANPQGVTIGQLLNQFKDRVDGPGKMSRAEWISIVRYNAKWGPDKKLRPKNP